MRASARNPISSPIVDVSTAIKSKRPQKERLTFNFLAAAIAVAAVFILSPQALVMLHYDYYFGPIAEKIHPATYLTFFFLALQFAFGDRNRLFSAVLAYPGVVLLPLAATALAIYDALFLAVPATTLIDTWLLPAGVFLLCSQLNARERGLLGNVAIAFFTIDALLGVLEVVANKRLVPLAVANATTGAYVVPADWRGTALLGHPLSNSYLMGCFILLVAFEPRIKSILLRLPVLAICSVSMLAFGSRAAMAFLAPALGLALVWKLGQAAVTGRIAKDVLIYLQSAIFAACVGVPILVSTGFADRFIARLDVDHGSASARTGAIEMVANLSLPELIIGIPRVEMVGLGAHYQIGDGVENFWLAFLLSFGLIGYLIFMPPLFIFCQNLVRASSAAAVPALIYFFACCSTSVSIASKSLMVAILSALILTGRRAATRARAVPQPVQAGPRAHISQFASCAGLRR
jgi:hypothetical protein